MIERARAASTWRAFLILSGLLVGVFCALDGLLFYVFFEATLIPMYLIIGVWGGPHRVYAAFKFFLYTLAGSLLMLVALIYLYYKSGGSFDILAWHRLPLSLTAQVLIFFAFFFAFAVKVPMWPVHTWLPDAHVEAPTGGSVVLAAIMLKLGAYGFLRFSLPIMPDASHRWAWLHDRAVADRGRLHRPGRAGAARHEEAGRLFVDRPHGLRHAGLLHVQRAGASGAIVQMVSHGFVSGAMFLCIGVLYDRVHSREISDYGGVANTMPKFAAFAVLFAMANCRPAGHGRLRRRVHGDPRHRQGELLDRRRRRDDADLGRRLHAVDGQARLLRRRRQRARRGAASTSTGASSAMLAVARRSPCSRWACTRSRSPT